MREIQALKIVEEVKRMCIDSNYYLTDDIKESIENAMEEEEKDLPKDTLKKILENAEIARKEQVPICQDTGMACVFVEIGQDVHVVGGSLQEAINEGVRRGYEDGYLRKSVVKDPLRRINTRDNTPAVINYEIVDGDRLKITLAPKGFGSENMSQIKMLKPSDGIKGVTDFVVKTVQEAGSNPCPPIVVGIGLGGTFDRAALMAKKALLRPINKRNRDDFYAELEVELLKIINSIGIGPQGFGGKTTALAVNIEAFPTHIAGLPVAVNINCHVTRHAEIIL